MGGHQIRETEGHSPEYSPALSSGISVHLETAVSELGVCGVVEGVKKLYKKFLQIRNEKANNPIEK